MSCKPNKYEIVRIVSDDDFIDSNNEIVAELLGRTWKNVSECKSNPYDNDWLLIGYDDLRIAEVKLMLAKYIDDNFYGGDLPEARKWVDNWFTQ